MFTSIWCDGSRPDLLYALELLTRSLEKFREKRSWENLCSGERIYRFRESDKDESKVAQR